ncbi:hypothetical protein BJ912DRAFT_1075454 [Pholiota molesta]|nr:hypothetical protein BJ912DRAFT_1075454 [Pholiota molesta]
MQSQLKGDAQFPEFNGTMVQRVQPYVLHNFSIERIQTYNIMRYGYNSKRIAGSYSVYADTVSRISVVKIGYRLWRRNASSQERMEYYDVINKAYTGDHSALAEFLLQGMRESMASVQSLGVSS